jgi:DNA-binding NarL/FixJ family response regulator
MAFNVLIVDNSPAMRSSVRRVLGLEEGPFAVWLDLEQAG